MYSIITAWLNQAILFATVILFGCMGEIITEKSGHLNLGIPGTMFVGGFGGFAGAFFYENIAGDAFNPVVCVIVVILSAFALSCVMGLIYSVLTVSLRANQNVTGLAITIFGVGVGKFFGTFILDGATATAVEKSYRSFSTTIPGLSGIPYVGKILFSYGFMVYAGIALAVVLYMFLNKTRTGLNLRAVGENPATADAAGINVTRYKYLAAIIGAGIAGIGGMFYVLDFGKGMWVTQNNIEALGWLAVALVIFSKWNPVKAIWGSILFGLLSWAYAYLPKLGVPIPNTAVKLVEAIPYVVTLVVLVATSSRKTKDNQPPAHLGLSYFREER